jgi:CheY-like chemotaxis protein
MEHQPVNTMLEIFLTDDDEDDRFIFRETVRQINDNIHLTEFNDGLALEIRLKAIDKFHMPHMIFLDIHMPVKSGIECLIDIRNDAKFCDIPVIMFTTSPNQEHIDQSYNCGANLYIRKAHSIEEGTGTLRKLFMDYRSNHLVKVHRDKYFIN